MQSPFQIDKEARAVARNSDPNTSWEAANSFDANKLNTIQLAVLEWFRKVHHATDRELEHALRSEYGPSTLRTRRSELVTRGYLRNSGQIIRNSNGKKVVLWELVDNPPGKEAKSFPEGST